MSHIGNAIFVATAFAAFVGFQNCDSNKTFESETPVVSMAAEGGGDGHGYEGKIYVNYGDCGDTLGAKAIRAMILWTKASGFSLTKVNCQPLNPPLALSDQQIALLSDGSLIYNNIVFQFVPGSSDAGVHLVSLAAGRMWSDSTYASSCEGYRRPTDGKKTYSGTTGSGIYLIQPNPALQANAVTCDMDTDGGGWTLFISIRTAHTNIDLPVLNQFGGIDENTTFLADKPAQTFVRYRVEGTANNPVAPVMFDLKSPSATGAYNSSGADETPGEATVAITQTPNVSLQMGLNNGFELSSFFIPGNDEVELYGLAGSVIGGQAYGFGEGIYWPVIRNATAACGGQMFLGYHTVANPSDNCGTAGAPLVNSVQVYYR